MLVSLVFAFIGIAVIFISLNTGSIRLSPSSVMNALLGYGTPEERMILYDYRLPRIIITVLAGSGLGVAGAAFQGVSRNSLADPSVLGINSGAAFGLMIYFTFFRTMEGTATLFIPLFTLLGGSVIAGMIMLLAYDRYRGLLPIRMILVGIAIGAGFNALTLLLSLRLDEDSYAFAARWLAGNVWGRDWIHVWTLLPWIAVFIPLIYYRSSTLDLLTMGDETAEGLGANVNTNRFLLLVFAVALSCASVAMVGGIGFIGLASPHIARRLVGPSHRHFLPVSAMIGFVILVLADTIGRSLFQPNAVPAGVVVAAIGGPYFLYLLFSKKK
nr:iron ABC transporter permease [Paenibacillus sp. XY044]